MPEHYWFRKDGIRIRRHKRKAKDALQQLRRVVYEKTKIIPSKQNLVINSLERTHDAHKDAAEKLLTRHRDAEEASARAHALSARTQDLVRNSIVRGFNRIREEVNNAPYLKVHNARINHHYSRYRWYNKLANNAKKRNSPNAQQMFKMMAHRHSEAWRGHQKSVDHVNIHGVGNQGIMSDAAQKGITADKIEKQMLSSLKNGREARFAKQAAIKARKGNTSKPRNTQVRTRSKKRA